MKLESLALIQSGETRDHEEHDSSALHSGNLLVETRNGLIVDAEVFVANGTAERDVVPICWRSFPASGR
jgi:hypothetical protein